MSREDRTSFKDDAVPGRGAYKIFQHTLELRYDDGRVKRFAFVAFPEDLAKQPVPTFSLIDMRYASVRWRRTRQSVGASQRARQACARPIWPRR